MLITMLTEHILTILLDIPVIPPSSSPPTQREACFSHLRVCVGRRTRLDGISYGCVVQFRLSSHVKRSKFPEVWLLVCIRSLHLSRLIECHKKTNPTFTRQLAQMVTNMVDLGRYRYHFRFQGSSPNKYKIFPFSGRSINLKVWRNLKCVTIGLCVIFWDHTPFLC